MRDERGSGAGYGYNINMPMPHGSPESAFFERLDQGQDAIRLFEPDVLVVALGFDIYKQDPQAKVSVSNEGFRRMGQAINEMGLPTLIVQEGGYYLEALADNAREFSPGSADRDAIRGAPDGVYDASASSTMPRASGAMGSPSASSRARSEILPQVFFTILTM